MPNHPAVVYFNTPHWIPIHYQALHQSIRALAGFLHQNGLCKGDRIGIYMQNRPEWVITDMATYALGAVVVPIYPTLSEHDVHYIINDFHYIFHDFHYISDDFHYIFNDF